MSNTPPPPASTGTTGTARAAPVNPKMGTTEETYPGSGVYYYAFGGAPKPDWTGIEDPSSRLLSDLCFRSLDPVSGQKSTLHRIKGLKKQYDRSQKLSDFQKNISEHLVKFGMDTIGFLPDPKDSTKVQSVVTYHARFTGDMEKALTGSKTISKLFDSWDRKNDYEARQFLLSSLSDSVKDGFETFHEQDDTFAATWLKLVHYLVTTTSKTYDDMKEAIRRKRPQQYPGQNIEKMATDYIRLAKEVDNAGYYSHGLTLNIVDGFLCASHDAKGTFHHALNSLRERVSIKEQETVFLPSDEQAKSFAQAKLSYKDVCLHAVKVYNELNNNNMWEPAKLPKDQTSPVTNLTKAQILNLIESVRNNDSPQHKASNKDFKQKGCFNCGEPGHLAKDCTKPKLTPEQSKIKRHQSMSKWKLTPPKSDEPSLKQINGKTFKWCQKCGNWTTTHDTSTHTGTSKTQPKGKKSQGQTNLAAWEPSAWVVETSASPSFSFSMITSALLYTYLVLSFAFLALSLTQSTPVKFTDVYSSIFIYMSDLPVKALQLLHYLYISLAPMIWFCTGYMACHIQHICTSPFNPITDGIVPDVIWHEPRKKIKMKLKSAKDHHLHPKYPLRLRNDNKFNTRHATPTVPARRALNFTKECLSFNCHCKNTSVNTASKSKRGYTQKKRHTQKRPTNSFCLPSPSKPFHYKPTGIPNNNDLPNLNFTTKQYCHLHKKAHQVLVASTKFSEETKSLAQKLVSLSPTSFRLALDSNGYTKSFPVIWDSGASVCVTPDKHDFISYQSTSDINEVKGLGGKRSTVSGQGIVSWSVHDTSGSLREFKLKAYHVPNCKSRLISTTVLLNTYKGEHLTVDATSLHLSGIKNDPDRESVMVFNNASSKLPTTDAYRQADVEAPVIAMCHNITTVHSQNNNLNESEKELLRWHQRLGHLAFRKIQHLMRTGVLSHTDATRYLHTAASKLTHPPKCAACLFGKQTVRSSPGRTSTVIKDRAGILRAGNLLPGAQVSIDHFISSVKGRLFQGYNKGSDDTRHVGGCIFIDHASSFIHVEFQSSLSSHETLRAKLAFERQCRDVGVVIQTYMSDNGKAFTAKDFTDHLSNFSQVSKFAGVGAHHHNAQAERAIRTIMSIARTMMIHAGIHWPDMAKPTLWPMSVAHACYLFNHVPNPTTGLSPSDVFTKTRWPHKRFHDMHVWGCPVYVLDKSLQDGQKIPRWKPRSNRSVYMGVSTSHASSVPLVLNVNTGSITPQYHIVFDDWFATVSSTTSDSPNFSSDEWNKMFGESRYQYVLDDEDENSHDQQSDHHDTLLSNQRSEAVSFSQEQNSPAIPLPVSLPPTASADVVSQRGGSSKLSTSTGSTTPASSTPEVSTAPESLNNQQSLENPSFPTDSPPERKLDNSPPERKLTPIRRSTRSSTRAPRLTYNHNSKSSKQSTDISLALHSDIETADIFTLEKEPDSIILLASKIPDNPDMFTYENAMQGEQRNEWIKAAVKEISSLEELKCWEEVPIDTATTKVLPGTWVFRVKRAPDGTFKKFKARYCIRGDLQEGDFETYAPVVSFSSVRLFLAWSLMLNWYTCTIDFSNAFIQASLSEPTFIHLPRGFRSSAGSSTCLRLKKSLYGLSVAPRLWFQHLLKALKGEGLIQSKHDPCLMYRKDLIVICHVDDLGLQVPRKEIVDQLIASLENKGFALTLEGSFAEYLGIQYEQLSNDQISMSQTGLIQKIVDAAGMNDCNPNKTPATRECLGSDPDGPPMEESWNYRSIVGMLLYLSTNSRPDISFAVSQVARFSHNPKQSHASAVKTIVRYLSGTKDKGTIYKRPENLTLDCYVDADFAGLYGREPDDNPTSVKSRTGYTISVGGCFLLCKSQLQSTIALSTSEAEYGALSQAMRTVIPIRETMLDLINNVDMVDDKGGTPFGTRSELKLFKTRVYEDNSAALSLAVNQKVTSRTKHWAVKFHFFWSHLNDKDKNMECLKVATKEQRADYLTKGLTRELFQHCRELNQGW